MTKSACALRHDLAAGAACQQPLLAPSLPRAGPRRGSQPCTGAILDGGTTATSRPPAAVPAIIGAP